MTMTSFSSGSLRLKMRGQRKDFRCEAEWKRVLTNGSDAYKRHIVKENILENKTIIFQLLNTNS